MSDIDPDGGAGTAERTFTKGELARQVAAAVRAATAKVREEYADYDDLRKTADAAKGQETALERMQKQLEELSTRNTKLDREAMVREVADELEISVRQARRLEGKTKAELLADGREFLEEFKPTTGGKPAEGTDEGEGSEDAGKGRSAAEDDQGKPRETAGRQGRPREELQSGTPVTGGKADETNPAKLAAMIPR